MLYVIALLSEGVKQWTWCGKKIQGEGLKGKLNLAEREALLHVFSNGRKPAQADLRIANSVLEEMGPP